MTMKCASLGPLLRFRLLQGADRATAERLSALIVNGPAASATLSTLSTHPPAPTRTHLRYPPRRPPYAHPPPTEHLCGFPSQTFLNPLQHFAPIQLTRRSAIGSRGCSRRSTWTCPPWSGPVRSCRRVRGGGVRSGRINRLSAGVQ